MPNKILFLSIPLISLFFCCQAFSESFEYHGYAGITEQPPAGWDCGGTEASGNREVYTIRVDVKNNLVAINKVPYKIAFMDKNNIIVSDDSNKDVITKIYIDPHNNIFVVLSIIDKKTNKVIKKIETICQPHTTFIR